MCRFSDWFGIGEGRKKVLDDDVEGVDVGTHWVWYVCTSDLDSSEDEWWSNRRII